MIDHLIAEASIELVTIGIIIAALVMGWAFTSGFIDEYGPLLGFVLALTVGTVLPAMYIIFATGGM